ncbi:MAG: ATP-binding protein [Bacillota bacterium]|nr:ATP-binding protein [Bacillota bacterium]
MRSLRQKILLVYLIPVLLSAAVGAWAIYNFLLLNRVLTAITRENYLSVLAAENMVGSLERQDSAELLLLLGEVRGGSDIYQLGQADFSSWLRRAEQNVTLPGEGEVVRRIKEKHEEYDLLFRRLHDLVVAGEAEQARQLYLARIEPLFKELRGRLQELLEMNHRALMEGNQRSRNTARRAIFSTVGFASGAILIGVLLGLGVSGAVVRPTVRLTEAVRRLGEGSAQGMAEITSNDKIGELAAEFNRMVARLRAYQEDVNSRITAEQEKAATILEVIDDGVILTDEREQVVGLNPAAEYILGLKSDEAKGKSIFWVTRQPVVAEMVREVMARGRVAHNRTISLNLEGEEHFFDVEVALLRGGPGEAAPEGRGAVVLLKDVTYFKRLERMKSDFLSDVSHELRTPLTSISMGLGLLSESKLLAGAQRESQLLATVQEEVSRLTQLVEELLALSRFEAGRVQLKLQSLSLAEFLQRVAAPFQPQAEAQGVELRLDLPEDLPALKADPEKLRSVVANLLVNALRYTPAGGRISVGARAKGGEVTISVSDTGPGIPAALREKIFDRFFQIGERPGGQAGLGLAIAREIVRLHGGRIWVESEEGKGATFSFTLPLTGPRGEAHTERSG